MTPWLSAIVPVHGGAHFLGATLASVAAEGAAGVEIRCYDSGDDDGAARDVAMSFADRLDIVWTDTPHIRPWTAKTNLGVQQARADHIVMLHQDDLWLPGHLAAARRATDASAALSVGPSRLIDKAARDVGGWRLPFAAGAIGGADLARTLIVQNTVAIPSAVIRRDAFLAVGGLDDGLWYTADWDLYLKLALAGEVITRGAATTAFRLHGHSLTMTGRRDLTDFADQLAIVLDRYLPRLAPLPPGVEARARASAAINCALAAASAGQWRRIGAAVAAMARLGPEGAMRLLDETRLADRVVARAKLLLAGEL
jgi:glycosyltransferase involved in cell wall biosynthesis